MQKVVNPYAAPASPLEHRHDVNDLLLLRASTGQRLVNYVIDWVCMLVLALFAGVAMGLAGLNFEQVPALLLNYVLAFVYYVGFECTVQQTPSKWITGTRVVNESGGVPTTKQMFIRAVTRLVPFDGLSFLGSGNGWHDRWSGTIVIKKRRATLGA